MFLDFATLQTTKWLPSITCMWTNEKKAL